MAQSVSLSFSTQDRAPSMGLANLSLESCQPGIQAATTYEHPCEQIEKGKGCSRLHTLGSATLLSKGLGGGTKVNWDPVSKTSSSQRHKWLEPSFMNAKLLSARKTNRLGTFHHVQRHRSWQQEGAASICPCPTIKQNLINTKPMNSIRHPDEHMGSVH